MNIVERYMTSEIKDNSWIHQHVSIEKPHRPRKGDIWINLRGEPVQEMMFNGVNWVVLKGGYF